MNDTIRTRFLELKITGQRFSLQPETTHAKDSQLISFLKDLIDNKEVASFEDVGFCLWNISDNYAFLKDGHSLMVNHTAFYNHLRSAHSQYLYWLVNDATQKLTLEKDGYSNYWWKLYQEAIDSNLSDTCFFAQYHTHRAALYKSDNLPYANENFLIARRNFEQFLDKTKHTAEFPFYQTMYLTQLAPFGVADSKQLLTLCDGLWNGLTQPRIESNFLIGEWQSFTTPFGARKQSIVGITAIVNSLIWCGQLKEAKELYMDASKQGLPKNHYIESRIVPR